MDRRAWWAAIYGVAQGQTRLKWLSMQACIGERNGNPLQHSCMENPRDRGGWWTAVYGVAQSRTRLKRLCSSSNRQVCPSLCDPMDCSLPGSSFRGIFQARILEWVAISFSKSVSRYCQISSGVQAHSQSITVDLKWRKWEECWEWMEFIMNFLLINISHLYCWSGWTLHSGSNTF